MRGANKMKYYLLIFLLFLIVFSFTAFAQQTATTKDINSYISKMDNYNYKTNINILKPITYSIDGKIIGIPLIIDGKQAIRYVHIDKLKTDLTVKK